MLHESVHNLARGKWRDILRQFGVDEKALRNRHGPCPVCGGIDRFRFDDKEGKGTFFCNRCGPGTGIDLLMKVKGWNFRTAAKAVEDVLGRTAIKAVVANNGRSEAEIRHAKRNLWKQCRPVSKGDVVDRYLSSRGLGLEDYPEALVTCDKARAAQSLWLPAMVAVVVGPDGEPASLHRTFLSPDGGKAAVEAPRKLMPGPIPDGACVRLSGLRSELCVAEGIETALAVERLYETPCWATINAAMMAKWIAPAGVECVTVFGDNDASFTGNAAAFTLARRLHSAGIEVRVRIPPEVDTDWNDVLMRAT